MKSFPLLALLFLTACSGAAFPQRVSAFGTVAASPRAGQPQASPVASSTLAPTDAGTATPDYQATTNAAQATSDASHLAQAQLSASQTSESMQATQAAYMLNLTSDAESRAAGATQQANRLQADSLSATRTQDGAVMAARAPTIIAAMTQAQYTQAHEVTDIGIHWALIAVLVGIGGLFAAIGYQRFRKPVDVNPLDPAFIRTLIQEAAPKPLERAAIPLPSGSLDLDTTPPGDADKFTELCRYALEGKPLGFGNVVHAGIYGSNAQYAPVREWMAKKEYYAPSQSGGTTLSKSGTTFCNDWVNKHAIPK